MDVRFWLDGWLNGWMFIVGWMNARTNWKEDEKPILVPVGGLFRNVGSLRDDEHTTTTKKAWRTSSVLSFYRRRPRLQEQERVYGKRYCYRCQWYIHDADARALITRVIRLLLLLASNVFLKQKNVEKMALLHCYQPTASIHHDQYKIVTRR